MYQNIRPQLHTQLEPTIYLQIMFPSFETFILYFSTTMWWWDYDYFSVVFVHGVFWRFLMIIEERFLSWNWSSIFSLTYIPLWQ